MDRVNWQKVNVFENSSISNFSFFLLRKNERKFVPFNKFNKFNQFNKEIAVVVIVEHGGHGYFTARAVKDIMEEYFGYNNDKIDEDLQLKSSEIQLVF